MYADVALWESYLADWQETYGEHVSVKAQLHKPFEWDMRGGNQAGGSKKVVEAHERLLTSIFDGKLRHAGQSSELDRLLRSHVLNAVRRDTVHGVSFGKESGDSPRKIDGYAALMLAHQCLNDYRLRGDIPDDNEGSEVWFF
jgi:hypothetical protein